jgi:hypothetical protein
MVMKKKRIFCTFESEHLHHYKDAKYAVVPSKGNDSVEFLKYPHRHLFEFRVEYEVVGDRQVEFILMKHQLKNIVDNWNYDLGGKSCEIMCSDLYYEMIKLGYEGNIKIEVSEDGENGAICEWSQDVINETSSK